MITETTFIHMLHVNYRHAALVSGAISYLSYPSSTVLQNDPKANEERRKSKHLEHHASNEKPGKKNEKKRKEEKTTNEHNPSKGRGAILETFFAKG